MGLVDQVSLSTTALGLVVSFVVYALGILVYRLYFHPLAKIPGPKFAAATFFCEFWYNIPKEGKYIYEIEKYHTKYGPIVRITPDEVHVADIDDYNKIYKVGTGYYKDVGFYNAFGIKESIFNIESNARHRVRRAALIPLFTPKTVRDLEWLVQKHVTRLCDRMNEIKGVIDLHRAFRCVSIDVITDYAAGRAADLLLTPDFGVAWSDMIDPLAKGVWVFKFMPFLTILMDAPMWLTAYLSAEAYGMQELHEKAVLDIQGIKEGTFKTTHHTIYHQLLNPEASEGHVVPTVNALADEGTIFMAAASETTGHAMEVAAMGILQNPEIHERLKAELDGVLEKGEIASYAKLEKLPYLTACIKEGIRLSYGVIGRLPRVVPASGDTFYGYNLPPGTVISSCAFFIHRQTKTWGDNPEQFNPELWLGPDIERQRRDQAMVAFSKGSRMCIGMNLAWSELYLTIGRVFHEFDLKMSDESSTQLHPYRDYFSTFPPPGQPGLLGEKVLKM